MSTQPPFEVPIDSRLSDLEMREISMALVDSGEDGDLSSVEENAIEEAMMIQASFDSVHHDYYTRIDYATADAVLNGMEQVSEDLLSRYEIAREEKCPGGTSCSICFEPMYPDPSSPSNSSGSTATGDDTSPRSENAKVVAFSPCFHIYHSGCIRRWLATETTCPMCRSNVDPNPLARGGGAERSIGQLEAWVRAKEKKMFPDYEGSPPDSKNRSSGPQKSPRWFHKVLHFK